LLFNEIESKKETIAVENENTLKTYIDFCIKVQTKID